MLVHRLRMRGLMSYTREIDVDHSTLRGMIAVTGRNGAGKSTLLDAFGPLPLFRHFSTRTGPLKDYATGRDAFVEWVGEYGGSVWRLLLQIDPEFSAGRGKVDGFVWRDGEALVNGRVSDYDEVIAKHLPNESVFFASAYTVQATKAGKGAQGFFGLDTAGRKALFVQLLGLEAMQETSRRAGAARKVADEVIATLDAAIAIERSKQADAADLATRIADLAAQADLAAGIEGRASGEALAAQHAHAQAEAILSQLAAARRQVEEVRDRYTAALTTADRRVAEAQARLTEALNLVADAETIRAGAVQLADATERHKAASRDYLTAQDAERQAGARVAAIAGDVAKARAWVDKLRAGAADLSAAQDRLARAESKVATYAGAAEHLATLTAQLAEVEARVRPAAATAQAEHTAATLATAAARRSLEAATKAAGLLDGVPCKGATLRHEEGGEARCGSCGFLTDAKRAADSLPTLAADLERAVAREATAKTAWEAAQIEVVNLEADRGKLTQARQAADELTRATADLTIARGAVASATEAQGAMVEAEARVTTLLADQAAAEVEREAAKTKTSAVLTRGTAASADVARWKGADLQLDALTRAEASIVGMRRELASATEAATEARTGLDAVVLPPEPAEASAAVFRARAALDAAEAALRDARARSREAADQLASTRGRLAQIGDVAERIGAIEAKRQAVGRKRAGFARIEEAFGPTGIQALAIDAAGPEVSTVTNDLLESCFGARFAIALRTLQEATKSRVQKEVFDIVVHDSEAGGTRTLESLSGGQQVLVDEALKLGIAIVNARQNSGMFRSLFRDEADGALDPEHAARYPQMLRRAMDLGGFERLYVISHRDAVIDACDHRIVVDAGTVTVD